MYDEAKELCRAACVLADYGNPLPNGFPWYLSDWEELNTWVCSICGTHFSHTWLDGRPRMSHEADCPVPRLEAAVKAYRE